MSAPVVKSPDELRAERLSGRLISGSDHRLLVAPLWPKKGCNLGTLLRTCDAVRACMAVPATAQAVRAVRTGNTIGDEAVHVHRIASDPYEWLRRVRCHYRIVAVELAAGSVPLAEVEPMVDPTLLLLGNEAHGIPAAAMAHVDLCVEIPMHGYSNSLNVAVAGSLVAYRLAGLA